MCLYLLFYVLFFSDYGKNIIKKLAEHYYPGPQHTTDCQQILAEWQKAKYDLLQWKENDLPQTISERTGYRLQLQTGACKDFCSPPTGHTTHCSPL